MEYNWAIFSLFINCVAILLQAINLAIGWRPVASSVLLVMCFACIVFLTWKIGDLRKRNFLKR